MFQKLRSFFYGDDILNNDYQILSFESVKEIPNQYKLQLKIGKRIIPVIIDEKEDQFYTAYFKIPNSSISKESYELKFNLNKMNLFVRKDDRLKTACAELIYHYSKILIFSKGTVTF